MQYSIATHTGKQGRSCSCSGLLDRKKGGDRAAARAFTVIQLLAVLFILSLLMALLLPALGRARIQARVTRAHAELQQITIAIDSYASDFDDAYPPTRCGCSANVQFQLPVELATCNYLSRRPGPIPQADIPDVFGDGTTYKYRAPGPIWLNGSYFDNPRSPSAPRAYIWVPDDFPACESSDGNYYYARRNEARCPVTYAVWSIGPDPLSEKFPRSGDTQQINEARFPLPRQYWYARAGDDGLITHFRAREGIGYTSP